MKWKIIPILIASFILVQCRSNPAGVLKHLSAEVKEIENVARAGNKNELAKLPGKIEQVNKHLLQFKNETSADRQLSEELASLQKQLDKAKQDALIASLESPEIRINAISKDKIQESPDWSSEDVSEVQDFLKCKFCAPLTNADCEQELIAKHIFPPNKEKELSDKIVEVEGLYKSMSEGNSDGAVRAYCHVKFPRN